MISRLKWTTSKKYIYKDQLLIPLGEEVNEKPIRQYSPIVNKIMPIIKPLDLLRNKFLVDGFVYEIIGDWIREFISDKTTFLDIGCGDLILKNQLPNNVTYNALDISFSEYTLDRVLGLESVNIVLASATKIPLKSNQVSMISSTNVLEHIPEIDRVLAEIYRIGKPDSLFLVCIPNNFCYKYFIKGQHDDHCNSWTYDGFVKYVESYGFTLLKGLKNGWWIPFPKYFGNISYQLPVSSIHEYYNTYFFYIFQTQK